MMKIVTLAGFGGQGIIKASILLGMAAMEDGLHSLQNQAYGPQSRGGISKGDVVVSDMPIYEVEPDRADIFIALSQKGLDMYLHTLGEYGTLMIDSDLVKLPAGYRKPDAVRLGATRIAADDMGSRLMTGILALGFAAQRLDVIKRRAVEDVVARNVPRETVKANLEAFGRGWEVGQKG